MDYKLLGVAFLKVFFLGIAGFAGMWVMLTWPVTIFYGLIGVLIWFFVWATYKDLVFKKRMKEDNERWNDLCNNRKSRTPAK